MSMYQKNSLLHTIHRVQRRYQLHRLVHKNIIPVSKTTMKIIKTFPKNHFDQRFPLQQLRCNIINISLKRLLAIHLRLRHIIHHCHRHVSIGRYPSHPNRKLNLFRVINHQQTIRSFKYNQAQQYQNHPWNTVQHRCQKFYGNYRKPIFCHKHLTLTTSTIPFRL